MATKDDAKALKDRCLAVCDDADNNRPGSREALRQFNSEHPTLAQAIVSSYGDFARHAEEALVHAASGGNVLVDESTRTWLAGVQSGLAEPGDTTLETMLAHRVALCWLAVNSVDALRAQKWNGSISAEAADFWDRHVSRLNADLLRAARALASVRKLRRPVVQVNIAEQQVNVAHVEGARAR